jgi:DNA-dependent RNA polymerase auxiliary subunit epsilon
MMMREYLGMKTFTLPYIHRIEKTHIKQSKKSGYFQVKNINKFSE